MFAGNYKATSNNQCPSRAPGQGGAQHHTALIFLLFIAKALIRSRGVESRTALTGISMDAFLK